jgi:hypothetical protein
VERLYAYFRATGETAPTRELTLFDGQGT